ncbi:MAG: hypothetical protein WCK91_02375 [bacterium]
MKNITEKFKSYFKALHTLGLINPHRYWIILVRAFFFVFIGLIFFSFYLLYKINNEEVFQASSKPKEDTQLLNEKLLKNVNGVFEDKAKIQSTIKTQSTGYKDPSVQ